MKKCLGKKKKRKKSEDLWVKIICDWKRQKIRMGGGKCENNVNVGRNEKRRIWRS